MMLSFSDQMVFKKKTYLFLYKISTPIVAKPYHQDHDSNTFKFTLPEDDFTQMFNF